MQKTYMANDQTVTRKWYIVDAEGQVLGRLASQVASVLRGKNKPIFTPHVDTGDFVVVINCDKMIVTGKKAEQKMVRRHTGYVGGLKEVQLGKLLDTRANYVLYAAVKGMLPKNSLGRKLLKKLRVYNGPEHEHQAQQPIKLELVKRYENE